MQQQLIINSFIIFKRPVGIVAKYKWNRNETKKQYEAIAEKFAEEEPEEEGDGPVKLPSWINDDQKEEFLEKGYLPINRKDGKGKPMVLK